MYPVWSSPQIATSADQRRTSGGRDGFLSVNHTTIGEPTSSCGAENELEVLHTWENHRRPHRQEWDR